MSISVEEILAMQELGRSVAREPLEVTPNPAPRRTSRPSLTVENDQYLSDAIQRVMEKFRERILMKYPALPLPLSSSPDRINVPVPRRGAAPQLRVFRKFRQRLYNGREILLWVREQ